MAATTSGRGVVPARTYANEYANAHVNAHANGYADMHTNTHQHTDRDTHGYGDRYTVRSDGLCPAVGEAVTCHVPGSPRASGCLYDVIGRLVDTYVY